ncbi:MAG: ABC transporter substrate-binding protein [Deltaproteobacteria bacterium]|nr:ABC transporter substrate-binding protein [Deltaproteobacteria bacterium]MBM4297281.1 ABC transporter substrate-binding protein [Deltaproteobacteria bacterium]
MPRRLVLVVISLVLSLSVSHAQELKKVRMGYPAFSLTFLTFFVAKDAGIYKKHGLDVEMVQLSGAVQTSALIAGEIDFLTGITGPLVAAARGLPFKGIFVTHDRTLFWIIGNPDIRRVEDLVGKTVAVDRLATLQDIVARDLIKRKGVNPDQVTYIQTGSVSNNVQALAGGNVAAAVLSLPHNVVMVQKGYREVASAPEFNLRSASGGIAAHETKLKKDPAGVKAVLRATLEAMEFNRREKNWMVNYIQNKWKITAKVAEDSYRLWQNGLTADGKIPIKELQDIYDQAFAAQLIPTQVPAAKVMDYALIDEVLRERK